MKYVSFFHNNYSKKMFESWIQRIAEFDIRTVTLYVIKVGLVYDKNIQVRKLSL